MSKSQKISEFIQTVEQLIMERAPGFTSKLPGQREIAARFHISQSSVHIAMAELEKRGLIRTVPYKGALVTLKTTEPTLPDQGIVNLAVCEDMPHQRDFWLDSVSRFEEMNDGIRVKLRFFSSHTEVEKAVSGNSNHIVIRPGDYKNSQLPFVPLREILPEKTLETLKKNFLPGLPDPDWNIALPYQLQLPALIYDSTGISSLPPENDIMEFFDWAKRNMGQHSMPVPDLNFLRDSCGLNRIPMLYEQESRISGELKSFFRILEKMAALRLINLSCAKVEDQLRQLKEKTVRCIEVFPHYWADSKECLPAEFRFAPPILTGECGVNFFLATAVLVGNSSVSDAEKAYFRHLISPSFQEVMMQRCLGISPYAGSLSEYRPPDGSPDLSRVIAWVRRTRFADTTDHLFDQVWYSVVKKLRSPVIVPLLLGKLTADDAETMILEQRLLAESYIESTLASAIYTFNEG